MTANGAVHPDFKMFEFKDDIVQLKDKLLQPDENYEINMIKLNISTYKNQIVKCCPNNILI